MDLSSMMSGPWATDILGDQGADVIKVEVPGQGDHVRSLPNQSGGMSAMFVNVNRSKRSLTLNLKSAEGVEVLKRLAAMADVLVQNFRPGVVERLGIGYEDVAAVNPRLVYLSMSGLGERGPLAGQRVYDSLVQALTGLTTIQAGLRPAAPAVDPHHPAGQAHRRRGVAGDHRGPARPGTDWQGPAHPAVDARERAVVCVGIRHGRLHVRRQTGAARERGGSFIDLIYQTTDGYVTVATNSNAEWQELCKALGHPEWIEDERFATAAGRAAYINERLELIQSELIKMSTAECLALMERFDVPAAPILKRSEVIEHPQVQAAGIIIETEHPAAGRLRQARVPARFTATVPDAPRGAPRLGEHTVEILAELGYDEAAIADLACSRAIGTEFPVAVGAPV